MIEIYAFVVLGLVIVTLAILIGWLEYSNRKERSKLINALVAKTPEQLRDLEFVDKIQPELPKTPSDLIPLDQLSDDEFDKHIQEELE